MSKQLILIRNAEVERVSGGASGVVFSGVGISQIDELAARLKFIDALPAQILTSDRPAPQAHAIALDQKFRSSVGHSANIIKPIQVSDQFAGDPAALLDLADMVQKSAGSVAVVANHFFTFETTRRLGVPFSLAHGEALVLPLAEKPEEGFNIQQAQRISLLTQERPFK